MKQADDFRSMDDSTAKTRDLIVAANTLENYCRICGSPHYGNVVSIYDEYGIFLQLGEKINSYLPITVSVDDELPLHVCSPCVEKVNIVHELIITCIEADARFLEVLQAEKDEFKVEDESTILEKDTNGGNTNEDSNTGNDDIIKIEPQDNLMTCEREAHIEFQVARVAEFCLPALADEGQENDSKPPVLDSQISKVLDTVENDTKFRIVEAVGSIVSDDNENLVRNVQTSTKLRCNSCDFVAPTNEDFSAHVCPKTTKQRQLEILCKVCNKKFKDAYKYTIHKQIHVRGSSHVCPKCGQIFSRNDSLLIHQMGHVAVKPHHCKHCDKRFLHRSSLTIHLANTHAEDKPWLCDHCGKRFSHRNNLRIHARCHMDESNKKRYKCEVCNKAFRNRFLVREHMKSHTGERPFHCSQCSKCFSKKDRLRQHEAIHLGIRPFQCSICSVGFIRKGNLTKHYKTHATDKVVMCRICKATFPSVAGLLNHRKSHSADEWDQNKSQPKGEKTPTLVENFQCNVCNKFLSSKLSLSLHMRVHTGEKPYQCEVCHKRFTQKPALTYHMRLHTGERPHACQFCGKGFNSKVGKESHERIHTGERPYKCGQCGVGFRCSANLRQHTWIHTDNRPFVCEVCSKLFRRREALQVHMRIHTGERPYSCPICGRSFTQKGDMLKHTRSHSKKTDRMAGVACLYCGQVFSQKKYYKMHIDKCSLAKEDINILKTVNGPREHQQQVFVQGEEVLVNEQGVIVHGEDMIVDGEEVLVHQPHQVVVHEQLVQLAEGNIAIKADDGTQELNTVTITSEDIITSFPEITIVADEIQEYQVEYQP